jgi:hypothetical protein
MVGDRFLDKVYHQEDLEMQGLYEQEEFWVDDSDIFEDESFIIDESDVPMDEQFIIEEDAAPVNDALPGAPDYVVVVEEEEAENDDPKTWEKDGDHAQFVQYLKDKKSKIPRHSGETVPGCERAKSYLKSLLNEISKAMRTDLEGVVDEIEIESIRKDIEDMIDRLDVQIKKLRGAKKAAFDVKLYAEGSCKKCGSHAPIWHDIDNEKLVCMHCEAEAVKSTDGLEKTAATPILNVYMSAFERAVVGTIINSKVSAGRNIEETYDKLKNKYNFTPREELAIQQLIADYGYPVNKDRGLLNEPSDPASGDGVEWQTNYQS